MGTHPMVFSVTKRDIQPATCQPPGSTIRPPDHQLLLIWSLKLFVLHPFMWPSPSLSPTHLSDSPRSSMGGETLCIIWFVSFGLLTADFWLFVTDTALPRVNHCVGWDNGWENQHTDTISSWKISSSSTTSPIPQPLLPASAADALWGFLSRGVIKYDD